MVSGIHDTQELGNKEGLEHCGNGVPGTGRQPAGLRRETPDEAKKKMTCR